MITIQNIKTYGWEAAIRGMRNPMNSWDQSDSRFEKIQDDPAITQVEYFGNYAFTIGDNDRRLMCQLVAAGNDHSKFMRQIGVSMDITAPLYWWKEFDTYKVGTTANSCSTMHKIAAKEFTVDDFSHEHLDGVSRDMFVQNDKEQPYFFCSFEDMLYIQVEALNKARELYLETKDKKYWWQLIQLLPSSYNQKRTVTLNYAVLRNQYHARKNHKLDEWKEYCYQLEDFPCGDLITMLSKVTEFTKGGKQ
jgi:hypothetical protein